MRLENLFTVQAPVDEAWDALMDVPRVVPCMPGTELVSVEGADRWKALMRVQMGPMKMIFDVDLRRERADEAGRNVVLAVDAVEQKGRGNAAATVTSSLAADGDASEVHVVTDVTLSGRVAQFARGVVEQVAGDMTRQFARNLEAELSGQPEVAAAAPTGRRAPTAAAGPTIADPVSTPLVPTSGESRPVAAPVRVDRMLGPAILRSIAAFFRRLFGR